MEEMFGLCDILNIVCGIWVMLVDENKFVFCFGQVWFVNLIIDLVVMGRKEEEKRVVQVWELCYFVVDLVYF